MMLLYDCNVEVEILRKATPSPCRCSFTIYNQICYSYMAVVEATVRDTLTDTPYPNNTVL